MNIDKASVVSFGPSLRDQFAMAALTGILANAGCSTYASVAIKAYDYADAMIKARKKEAGE